MRRKKDGKLTNLLLRGELRFYSVVYLLSLLNLLSDLLIFRLLF